MRISVDTRLLQSDEVPEARDFTKAVYSRLAIQHPQHEFVFITDSELKEPVNFPPNVTVRKITPQPTNVVLYKWWYDVKLSLALKKYKADIFIASYGLTSLTTAIPQLLVIRDLAFLKKRTYFPFNSYTYYKRFTRGFIKSAKTIVTLSDFVKEELVATYDTNRSSIQTIGSGVADLYKAVSWEEREGIKEQVAAGCEYFVFTAQLYSRANFLNTIKAFSIFKKWQKTNMKLVIAGDFDVAFEKDFEKLKSYKYRQDVIIERSPSGLKMSSIIAGSYAMIFPSFYEGFATPVLAAMKCEVPLITSFNSSMSEIAGDAALYADVSKPEEIATQMKLIFKDEVLRNKLVDATKNRAKLFDWDKTAALLWKVIEETLSR